MKFKISTEWDKGTRKRKLFSKSCKRCRKEFWIPRHVIEKRIYCSRECRDFDKCKLVEVLCVWCKEKFLRLPSKIVLSKSGLSFCSRNCKDEGQQIDNGITEIWPDHYGDGESSYRIRAFRKYDKNND